MVGVWERGRSVGSQIVGGSTSVVRRCTPVGLVAVVGQSRSSVQSAVAAGSPDQGAEPGGHLSRGSWSWGNQTVVAVVER